MTSLPTLMLIASLAFEVVSIKPYVTDPAKRLGPFQYLPNGFHVEGALPLLLITQAFQVRVWEVNGLPSWAEDERYEITAKADRAASREEIREMMQTMLADRFHLRFHRETKPATVLALTVDKPGKIVRSEDQNGAGGFQRIGLLKSQATRVSMAELCQYIGNWQDVKVIDKTGLSGFYDFTLAFIPAEGTYGLPPGVEKPDYPDVFQAVKEQLGLKLEKQKGEVEILVIDHIEKPATN